MPDLRAAALIVRRGPFAMQGEEAARGLELWAGIDGVELELVDDPAPHSATEVYQRWMDDERIHLVLGPYGSGLVRRILPTVGAEGKMLWNHGGSADDLSRPGAVQMASPASTYLVGAVRFCSQRGIGALTIVVGAGPFSVLVARGARDEARRLGMETRLVIGTDRVPKADPDGAILITAGFQDDIAAVERIRTGDIQPGVLGCVAAGVPQFGQRLGSHADGVLGPTQWTPGPQEPQVGPSALGFGRLYEEAYSQRPGYVAAQAAAAGFLAATAHRRGMSRTDLAAWRTSTLLGSFSLDEDWRQVGHTVSTIMWRGGRVTPLPAGPDPG